MSRRTRIIETERLQICKANPADADFYYSLWTNGRVMSNVGFPDGLQIERNQIKAQLVQLLEEGEFDSLLIVILKETGEAIGECRMSQPDENSISTTDVKLLPDYWGHRYGIEIKQALIDYLFANTSCLAVEATPNINNVASIKMQEAVGGVCVGENITFFPDSMKSYTIPVHHYIYRVYRPEDVPSPRSSATK